MAGSLLADEGCCHQRRFEYALTEKRKALGKVMLSMDEWGAKQEEAEQEAASS